MPLRTEPATPPSRRRSRAVADLLVAAAAAMACLTACGGDAEEDGGTAAATSQPATTSASSPAESSPAESSPVAGIRSITATEDDFSIDLDEADLPAGEYEIEVVNEGDGTHDLVVERDGEDVAASDTIGPGESTIVTVTLEPGDYVFYCSIGNHRAMGMEIPVQVT